MSTLIVRCPSCGARNRVDRDRVKDSRARCARCREILDVPAPQTGAIEITDQTFAEVVERSPIPVLLEVWSPYCMHCQTMEPIFRRLLPEASQTMRVGRINLDENRTPATRYGVTATPTLLVLDRGKVLDHLQGVQGEDQLRYRLHRHLHP